VADENKSEDITEARGKSNEEETSKRELNYSTSEEKMEPIKINVNKQNDGYTFVLLPSIRKRIKMLLPRAHPANMIHISYDTKRRFTISAGKLEKQIFPALLGINDPKDLMKLSEILFVDIQTGSVLYRVAPPSVN
jgi:hypothetical protein